MSRLENIVLELQSGVRKWVLFVLGASILLSYPAYLAGIEISKLWFYKASINPYKLDNRQIVMDRKVMQNEVIVDTVNSVELINGQKVIYTFLDNRQNMNIGYNPFVYQLQIVDKDQKVLSDETRKTYLLPGQAKYISATTSLLDAASILVKKLPESSFVEYNPDANNFLKNPDIEIREKTVEPKDKDNLTLKVSLKNTTNLIIKDLDMIILIRDSLDSITGIQDYRISGFLPGENREIKIDYPKSKTRTAKTLDVRYSVNYLQRDSLRLK